jgi:acyl carrier protein
MFSLLGEQSEETMPSGADGDELLLRLSAAPAAERAALLATHLQELVARVLKLDPAQFSLQESLTSLGIDSMMAIEVKHRIEASVKVDISVLELLQGTTVTQLAKRILALLQLDEPDVAAGGAPSSDEIQQLMDLADSEDLERLLAELEQTSEFALIAE